ncbi:hypothetical protein GWK48_00150 [Metallosphaera tengchongensis]|uniref:Uncharacterized protein n=1 Tax=Metallosphaera tengchongensis TaxID=1532350 RepID=A0A6N0NQ62_9CREN|nr:hypothetical protein [Metallosphaera tengchongensis]QKQ99013.1 hypothetical protein GWK48_00150 [Metallosphaera tengchongensis]
MKRPGKRGLLNKSTTFFIHVLPCWEHVEVPVWSVTLRALKHSPGLPPLLNLMISSKPRSVVHDH